MENVAKQNSGNKQSDEVKQNSSLSGQISPNANKKVLICIPTYNRAQKLEKQLFNLSKVEDKLLDIAVFDNASTDTTQNIVTKLLEEQNNIKYFKNSENLQYQGNIIKILEYAKEVADKYYYLYILSDDDIIFANNLNQILSKLEPKTNLVLTTWFATTFAGDLSIMPMPNHISNDLLCTIHFTALISSYMYPMNFLQNYDLEEFKKFASNVFLHMKLTIDCLKKNQNIDLINTRIGYINANFTFRFDLLQVVTNRYEMLKYADEELGFNKALNYTSQTVHFFLNRLLTWNTLGNTKQNKSLIPFVKWIIKNKFLNSKSIVLILKLMLIKLSLVKKIFFIQRRLTELQGMKLAKLHFEALLSQNTTKSETIFFNHRLDFHIRFNKIIEFINKLKQKNSSFALYGFSNIGKYIVDNLENSICVIVDKEKKQKKYKNINIITPKALKKYTYDYIILAVLGREEEIEIFLNVDLGIPKEKIIPIDL